jgi:hypothetical protein
MKSIFLIFFTTFIKLSSSQILQQSEITASLSDGNEATTLELTNLPTTTTTTPPCGE